MNNIDLDQVKTEANELSNKLDNLVNKYELRKCSKCGTWKFNHEFNKGKKETMCSICRKEYNNKRYQTLVKKAKAYDEEAKQ